MAYKDPEKKRQNAIAYRQTHREELREKGRIYRETHKEKRRESQTAWRLTHIEDHRRNCQREGQQIKFEVLGHYSIPGHPICLLCGIDDIDVLCIDHINDNGAEHRRTIKAHDGGSNFYYWIKRNGYPEGYQTLCANCNLKKEILRRRLK